MTEPHDAALPSAPPSLLELCRLALDRSLDAVTILQSVRDGSGAIVDFTWVYVNDEAAAVLRQPKEALVGHNLLDVLPGNRDSGLFDRYVQVVESGVSRDGAVPYDADGLRGWYRNMTVRLGDGVAVFFREVTVEKRTAEALRVSEERRRLAVEAAGLGDWYFNLATRSAELSRQCKLHLGLPLDAAPTVAEIVARVHPEDRVAAGLDLEDAFAHGRPLTTTQRVLWPDGSLRWVSVRGRGLPGRPGELVGVTLDVTDQVWSERSQHFLAEAGRVLAEARDVAQTVARVSRLAIPDLADFAVLYLIGPGGAVQRAAVAHRRPAGEAALRELERRYPLPDGDSPVARVLRGDLPLARVQLTEERRAASAQDPGQHALFEALGAWGYLVVPLSAGGERLGALLIATTTRGHRYGAREEEVLAALAERVSAAIASARLSEAERAAWASAELAARQRDDLLAFVAHDLKNPLTAILGAAQLLQRRLHGPAPPDVERLRRGLATMETAAKSLAAQLNEIQDAARLQAGKPLDLQRQPVDLVALARRAAAVRQTTTEQHQIEVAADAPELWCSCDQFRIERVVANLLANAVKYSPGGGQVVVQIAREGEGAAGWALVAVRDQGVGIAPEDLPHVFDRFYRGANVAGVSGSGIGLASVAAIVEQHGGQVSVDSAPGRGTTVAVRLPLGAPALT